MSTSPEKWIDLLSLYGPMALFVFMILVGLRVARTSSGLSAIQKKVQVFAFAVVWVSIFVFAGMIAVAWWRVNFPEEFIVNGTIHTLRYPEVITTDQELYLHRHVLAVPDFEYQWRLISPRRFTGNIEFILQKDPKDTQVLKYNLPIRSEFYKGTVDIQYDRASGKMTLLHGTYSEEILPREEIAGGNLVGPGLAGNPTPDIVYADPLPQAKPENLIRALDADDATMRAAARRDLIRLGPLAVPSIEQALTDPASSYRLRVGALSVAKDLNDPAKQALGEAARCAIAVAAHASDSIMQAQAAAVIAAGVAIPPTCPRLLLKSVRAGNNVKRGSSWEYNFTVNGQSLFEVIEDSVTPGGISTHASTFPVPAGRFELQITCKSVTIKPVRPVHGMESSIIRTNKGIAPVTGVTQIIPDLSTPIVLHVLGSGGEFTFEFGVTTSHP